ncbi:hypothetical protein BSZ10_07300 [Staphylococcus aureus]|nr:hypothetical protein BSZ10_07300 [Staphylococcus aureus]
MLCLLNFLVKFSLLGPHSQLALLVEFLSEILFAGAPPTSARMIRTEKCLI